MPLGRTQTQIIDKLEEMGKLSAEAKGVLIARVDPLSSAFDAGAKEATRSAAR